MQGHGSGLKIVISGGKVQSDCMITPETVIFRGQIGDLDMPRARN